MPERDASELRHDARVLRQRALSELPRIVHRARQFASWRYHFKRHLWAILAAASAVGFLAVPRRAETVVPDPEKLADLARRNKVVIAPSHPPRGGLARSALGLVSNVLVREGLEMIGRHFGERSTTQAPGIREGRGAAR